MNDAFKQQLSKQRDGHGHDAYTIDLDVSRDLTLNDFSVHEDVLRPEKMAASLLASWLSWNNGLYRDSRVLDMGCGSGIQGIVTLKRGAKTAVLTDVMSNAVKNTEENVEQYGLTNASVTQGDLFENVTGLFDHIIFNHPFFPAEPRTTIEKTMTDDGSLVRRFFEAVDDYARPDADLIMPFFEAAGTTNHPADVADEHGYEAELAYATELDEGLQQGSILIYRIPL